MNAIIHQLVEHIKSELQKELVLQKHIASETLYNSINVKLNETGDSILIEGWTEDYGQWVDTGRRPGVKRVPLKALEEWIKIKQFERDIKKIRGLAFVIQKRIFEEGIPTKGSQRLAPRRKDWISGTLEKQAFYIKDQIIIATKEDINIWIDNTIQKVKSMFI